MRAALAVSVVWFACLRFACLAQSPGGAAAAVSVSTCSLPAAAASSTASAGGVATANAAATAVSDVVDGDGAETGCDKRTEPFTGIPGTARERSFFVSGGSIAKSAVCCPCGQNSSWLVEVESLVASSALAVPG